jgi:hypothetical protein
VVEDSNQIPLPFARTSRGRNRAVPPGTLRERVCIICGAMFSYIIHRGSDRQMCGAACRNESRRRHHARTRANAPLCTTIGCEKRARNAGLYWACYSYAWRTGQARDPRRKPYKLKQSRRCGGKIYRVLRVPGHPLARKTGEVYHHRLIAYSSSGGICNPCHWCGAPLDWTHAVVDHLNEDGEDNMPINLVVACNRCNLLRGSMLPFFRSLKPERLDQLMTLMFAQVNMHRDYAVPKCPSPQVVDTPIDTPGGGQRLCHK